MTKQPDFAVKEFCLNLLQSETEEEVIDALKNMVTGETVLYGNHMGICQTIEALLEINKVHQ